ncbi:MAG: glycosyltransferase [Bacteroidales bacterium]|nr:glycosyltransferase [Bacteroidales bacterium]
MLFSIIVPVFNRPNEISELLDSLSHQTVLNFEVIIVEDGSTVSCHEIVKKYDSMLKVRYYYKENSGPGDSRNYGASKANGDYFIILDSDCIIPPKYMAEVTKALKIEACDAFGGPDKAHSSFSTMQKAINYSMTSFFTTGGIRGGNKKLDKFYPRSFNLGVSKEAFTRLNGFSNMRFGEDIDFSIRLFKAGYKVRLFSEAWVYHKRRVDLRKFYRQVFNSGIARINLFKKHPESLKLVHLLPTLFTITMFSLAIYAIFFNSLSALPIILYILIVFLDSTFKNHNIQVGLFSIPASFVQLFGYGLGFLKATWRQIILQKSEFKAFEKNFYN